MDRDPDRRAAGARRTTPPVESPGPSVTAPVLPESDVERAKRADFNRPDPEVLGARDPDDALVAEEESAAAAEAATIGGPGSPGADDPAMQPLYEAGQGDQDGWEAAERDLIENATHSDGGGNPLRDAMTPEVESDRSGAAYGAADFTPSTAAVDDPGTDGEDAGAGPGIANDRWS